MAPHVLGQAKADARIALASEWQLVRWKFARHRLAVESLAFLIVMYLGVVFAEFISPYDPSKRQQALMHTPPHLLHFVDKQGRFTLRPFVFGVRTRLDPKTLERVVVPDESKVYPLRFLVQGDAYRLGGLIPGDLHLFGVDRPGRLVLLGTDKLGRDLLSLIVFGSRVSLTIGLVGVALSLLIASITLSIPGMILGETSLSFIGLGLQAPAISWGVLLTESQAVHVLATAPWLLLPALFVIATILAFNFVGDGLRDAADPYARVEPVPGNPEGLRRGTGWTAPPRRRRGAAGGRS